MAIQWVSLDGSVINETTVGGAEWVSLGGAVINEQAAAGDTSAVEAAASRHFGQRDVMFPPWRSIGYDQ